MFGSSTFIFQSVKEGMSVCQCIVYIGGFVGSQRQKLVESQNRFTTDIFLFKNPCMIFEVSTGSYTPLSFSPGTPMGVLFQAPMAM